MPTNTVSSPPAGDAGRGDDVKAEESNRLGSREVLGRGWRIIQTISAAENGLTLKDIVDQTGLPESTTYRLLRQWEARDVLRQGRHKVWTLGPELFEVAARVARSQLAESEPV